ncbi:MAG: response regulator [Lachnospiraceae bacterium]|nr:response regulator [Lachnospiraceae bacterium]
MDKSELYRKILSGQYVLAPEKVDIRELIRGLVDSMAPLMKENYLHFRYKLEKIIAPTIMADKGVLTTIFRELLVNAMQFTPDGGDVIFNVSEIHRSDRTVMLEIYVQDNGIGMTPDYNKKLFKPHATCGIDPEMEGEGYGLAIVKELITMMHGTITCESGQGMGTIMLVLLEFPVADQDGSARTVPTLQRDYYNFTGKTVLLVEDHPLNLDIARQMLESVGCTIVTAGNGLEAVEQFEKQGDKCDIILMDIRMPVMDGIEATRKIRSMDHPKAETIPIIALTASAYEGDIHRSSMAGMNGSVLKPINPQKLFGVMSEYLFNQDKAKE